MEQMVHRYGGERQHPLGLALVIGGHIAVLGAIILSPPEFVRDPITRFVGYNVPIDPPPPPNPPDTPPPPEKHVPDHVDRVDRMVDTHATAQTEQTAHYPDVLPPPRQDDTGAATVPAPPEPVFAQAQIDSRGAFQPDYPPAMARQAIDGVAVVRVLIGADGRVREVQMVSASDPAFYAATERQALRHWRFRPATRDGVAVESWRTMTVRFRMEA